MFVQIAAVAWRKRGYEAAFIAKLNYSEASVAAETQTWLKFAVKCSYLDEVRRYT